MIDVSWSKLDDEKTKLHWAEGRSAGAHESVTLRLGANATTLKWTVNELKDTLDVGFITVHGTRNIVRWSGTAEAETVRRLRLAAATHSVPLTIEQAPWPLLRSEGHFGEMRSGTAQIVASLRSAFDPAGTLVVPLTTQCG